MFKRIARLAATLSLAAILGATLAGAAFAQGPAQPGANLGAGRGAFGPAWGGQSTLDTVSKLTGLSVEDIQAQRQDGKSLLEIANVAKDKLVATILSAKKSVVDGLVTAGTLTQDQATIMLDNMETRVSAAVERTATGPVNGRANGGNGVCLTDGSATPGAALQTGVGRMGGRGAMGSFGAQIHAQPAQ